MLYLQPVLYDRISGELGDYYLVVDNPRGLSFSTSLHGGFYQCRFVAPMRPTDAADTYRSIMGMKVVVYDAFGRVVYEGRIEDVALSSEGVEINALGYYSHSDEKLHGLVYPDSAPKTPSDIVKDTVMLTEGTGDESVWRESMEHIEASTVDVTPQDFTDDQKLQDAIETVTGFGHDPVDPKPMYFAIWEQRIPYFFVEKDLSKVDWDISVFNLAGGITFRRSLKDVYNRIWVAYNSELDGSVLTTPVEDILSQTIFRMVREGVLNAGDASDVLADVLKELAVEAYAFPKQTFQVDANGYIYTPEGQREYLYMLRAGDVVRLRGVDQAVNLEDVSSKMADALNAFVLSTTYDYDKNTLRISVGSKGSTFESILTQHGISGGLR